MDNLLITLVVINYNKLPYIGRALQSILEQSYRPAEVILFDDCSTDGSDVILREFAQQHRDWVLFIQPEGNLGSPAASLNRALSHVRTDLWASMSSDDFMDPDCLKHLVSKYRRGQYDALIANVCTADVEGAEIGKHFAFIPDDSEVRQVILEYRVNSARQMLACTEFIRRIGGYNESLTVHEDHELLIRMVLNGRVAFCEPAIYYWRKVPDGVTSTMSSDPEVWRKTFQFVYDNHYRLWPLTKKLGLKGALKARKGYKRKTGLSSRWIVGLYSLLGAFPGVRTFYRALRRVKLSLYGKL